MIQSGCQFSQVKVHQNAPFTCDKQICALVPDEYRYDSFEMKQSTHRPSLRALRDLMLARHLMQSKLS